MKLVLIASVLAILAIPAVAAPKGPKAPPKPLSKEESAVAETLDLWHLAASKHEEDAYFSLMTKDAVFLGTDPSERWPRPEFQKWAHPIFAKGKGWTIQATRRNVFLGPDKRTAWFDEDVESKELGPARGSGVLVKDKGKWKVSQYNLSIPVPNEKFDDVRKLLEKKAASKE